MDGDSGSHENHTDNQSQLTSLPRRKSRVGTWQAICAVFGFAGGIVSALFGAVFTALSWLPISRNSAAYLHTLGTVVFYLTIPLLIFGGYCLDLLEDKPRAINSIDKSKGSVRRNHHPVIGIGLLLTLLTVLPQSAHAQQIINSRLTFAADWLTGKHAAGYFTSGLTFKPHPRLTGYAACSLGNTGLRQGNHFFLLKLGVNLN
ncbi:MAG: hypothetical protein ABR577_16845 [Pyrinomonadaceae bacterium]